MLYKDDEILLEENGWDIECQSPLEIRNRESGSFATGEAARIVVNSLKPRDRSPRSLISDLEPDDKYYIDKLNILHQLVTEPNFSHIIPAVIANWCKSVGLCAEGNCEDRTSWWTCRVKDKNSEENKSKFDDLNYRECFELAEHLYNWMAEQKYYEEALLHAEVCCDHAGMTHFKAALANQITKFINEQ